jgi:hypothetical protein
LTAKQAGEIASQGENRYTMQEYLPNTPRTLSDVGLTAKDDPDLLVKFRDATTNPKHLKQNDSDGDNITINTPERGTPKAYTLTRLKNDAPEIYEQGKE